LKSINVIAPYRYQGTWVFDDSRAGLIQEPFISGADTLIDHAVANILGADHGFFLIFSAHRFPGHTIRMIWRRADVDGNWYYSEGLEREAWLCPALLKYFDHVPGVLYLQCKAKSPDAKHPSEWAVSETRPIADDDLQESVLPVRPSGAAAQLTSRQAGHAMTDVNTTHVHRIEIRAVLRSCAVLVLFLIVMGSLIFSMMGPLRDSRQSGYIVLAFIWFTAITGIAMLARLWLAIAMKRMSPPREPKM
jgi:hypothetical protein